MSDDDRPPICRCGGIGLCKACNMDAALHWGRENNRNPPAQLDPEKMDYLVSFTDEVREALNTLANQRLAEDNILEKLLNTLREIQKSQNSDKITIDPYSVRMEPVSYSSDNFLKKE